MQLVSKETPKKFFLLPTSDGPEPFDRRLGGLGIEIAKEHILMGEKDERRRIYTITHDGPDFVMKLDEPGLEEICALAAAHNGIRLVPQGQYSTAVS